MTRVNESNSVAKGITLGRFQLEELVLYSYNGKQVDISQLYLSMEVFEDMFSNTLSGTISISDSLALAEKLPIIGQEKIKIRFKSAGYDGNVGKIDYIFDVYKIGEKQAMGEGVQFYTLHFFSPEMRWNIKQRISRAYVGKSEAIVEDIVRKTLHSEKQIIRETSKFDQHVVVPNWHPFTTINWLGRRTSSNKFAGSGYLFFENSKSQFIFTSLEALFSRKAVQKYTFAPGQQSDQKNVDDRDWQTAFRNILSMTTKGAFDSATATTQGMFANRLCTYDPITKKYVESDFSYSGSYDKYVHLEETKKQNTHTILEGVVKDKMNKTLSDYPDAEIRWYPMHKDLHGPNVGVNADAWYQHRISQMQQIDYHKVTIVVNGDSARKVGEVVELDLPSKSSSNGQREIDKYLNGRYIITAIRHTLVPSDESYQMTMDLAKDSLYAPVELLSK